MSVNNSAICHHDRVCGRYNDHLQKMIGWVEILSQWPELAPRFNIPPTTQIAAFRGAQGEVMRWGMIPSWAKSFESSYTTHNAKAETVAEKATFRNAWNKSQHCLIPMAGYFEWKGPKGAKQPYYVTDRDTGCIVTAGLYETWGDDDRLSCTMITVPADETLSSIHPRMPLMLTPDSATAWLSGDKNIDAFESPNVIFYPVSKAVGSVRNDEPDLVEPVDV